MFAIHSTTTVTIFFILNINLFIYVPKALFIVNCVNLHFVSPQVMSNLQIMSNIIYSLIFFNVSNPKAKFIIFVRFPSLLPSKSQEQIKYLNKKCIPLLIKSAELANTTIYSGIQIQRKNHYKASQCCTNL